VVRRREMEVGRLRGQRHGQPGPRIRACLRATAGVVQRLAQQGGGGFEVAAGQWPGRRGGARAKPIAGPVGPPRGPGVGPSVADSAAWSPRPSPQFRLRTQGQRERRSAHAFAERPAKPATARPR